MPKRQEQIGWQQSRELINEITVRLNLIRVIRHIKKMSNTSASLLLVLLLSADIIFIVLHVIIGVFNPNPEFCSLTGICAYMDSYHLIKLFWIIFLLFYVLKLTKLYGYAAWALMFTCFFIDDAFWLHQKVGDRIATLIPGFGMPARFYELAVLAIAGLALLALVIWFYMRGSVTFQKVSLDMSLFLAALVFFGIIVDIADTIGLGHTLVAGLQFVEDGGELVVYSLILWYVFLLALRQGKPEAFLVDLLSRRFVGNRT
jgi:hypothetical protein